MSIMIANFDNAEIASKAADYLRNRGFSGDISILGRDTQNDSMRYKGFNGDGGVDTIPIASAVGAASMWGGFTPVGLPGMGIILAAGTIAPLMKGAFSSSFDDVLAQWGVPGEQASELKKAIDAGDLVMMVKCDKDQTATIKDILHEKGAENVLV